MGLVEAFKLKYLKNAVLIEERDSLTFLKDDRSIYIIADSNQGSIISENVKSFSLQAFSSLEQEKVFVTLFNTKDDFADASDEISWGSYVWIASEPNHTIHYDSKPSVKPRLTNA